PRPGGRDARGVAAEGRRLRRPVVEARPEGPPGGHGPSRPGHGRAREIALLGLSTSSGAACGFRSLKAVAWPWLHTRNPAPLAAACRTLTYDLSHGARPPPASAASSRRRTAGRPGPS